MNTQLEILKKVRERLSISERWTFGWYAKDNHLADKRMEGHCVAFNSPTATCWCLIGAIMLESYKLFGEEKYVDESNKIDKFLCTIHKMNGTSTFNDCHTHKDILNLLDAAIILLTSN